MLGLLFFNGHYKGITATSSELDAMQEEIDTLHDLMERAKIGMSHTTYQDMVDKKKEEYVLSIHDKPIQEQHDRKKNGKVYITYATKVKGETSYTKANSYENLIEKLYEKYSKSGDVLTLEALFFKTMEERTGDINNNIAGKTLFEYQRLWNSYYKDYPIAKISVKKIDTNTLMEHFTSIIREHKLTKTQVKNIRIVINMVAKYCLRTGILTHNFASDLVTDDLPYKKEPAYNSIKAKSFSTKNTEEIINWAKERIETNKKIMPVYMYALIIGMTLGIRYAELHAIKWSDVDFERLCLTIRKQRTLEYDYKDGRYICKGRKDKDTLKGNEEPRLLPMMPDVEEALKSIKALNLSDEYVFPDGHFRYNTYNNKVKEAAAAIGLNPDEYRSHSVRTTAATNLYDACKDVYQVQSLLGHTNTQMTMKYIKEAEKYQKLRDTMFRTFSDQSKSINSER